MSLDLRAEAARRQANLAAGRRPTDDGTPGTGLLAQLVAERASTVRLRAVTTRRCERPWNEAREQEAIVRLFVRHGCEVRGTSQQRASRVAEGLPDLVVFHRASAQAWWWETKYGGAARWSAAQRHWAEFSDACGWRYGLGDLTAAYDWLVQRGIITHQGER